MFHDELSLNKEVNRLYDRLQQAHEERDKYKKALEEIATQDPTEMHLIAKYDWVIDIAKEALK